MASKERLCLHQPALVSFLLAVLVVQIVCFTWTMRELAEVRENVATLSRMYAVQEASQGKSRNS